ncbi:hypothetical protein [Plebeiibacterium marinum]|uniref:Uncharacterized protein n=1 Tax=Plebeiibacterium marinum TaxID=2992111 RepID=A0AAE3SJY6_9BACT|nr:hypothetical protein [Plebeiobacterium marinum]MCW3805943.1 hypothetical protein [Plebeiobacterium marinum]
MKMLVATTVEEYREKLQQFFSEQKVQFYNEFEVKGVDKGYKSKHRVGNWFSDGDYSTDHIAFFTIIEDDQANQIMANLNQCKNDMPKCNIKAYILNIEQMV